MDNITKAKQKTARAILSCYPQIQEYCDAQQKINYRRILSGFNNACDTQSLMERIIDKAYAVQQLHNMKVKVERRLRDADPKVRKVIELAYFKNMPAPEIGKRLGVSERTAFRLTASALDWFANGMENLDAFDGVLGTLAAS